MRLYEPTSTPAQLSTNGTGVLLCEYATVHEEINGEFSLTMKVAQESPFFDAVVIGAIVKADTPRGVQFFDFQSRSPHSMAAKRFLHGTFRKTLHRT